MSPATTITVWSPQHPYYGARWHVTCEGKTQDFEDTLEGRAGVEDAVLEALTRLMRPDASPAEPVAGQALELTPPTGPAQVWHRVPIADKWWCDVSGCDRVASWHNAASGHYRCASHLQSAAPVSPSKLVAQNFAQGLREGLEQAKERPPQLQATDEPQEHAFQGSVTYGSHLGPFAEPIRHPADDPVQRAMEESDRHPTHGPDYSGGF